MNTGTGLLEQAITYATRSVLDVTPALLPRPTPCRGWNLDLLLRHASESLDALHDGTLARHIALIPAAPDRLAAADPAQTFRDRAGRLLTAQATAGQRQTPCIGDLPLPAFAMECVGAIEVAVHGWDISQACGQHRPIPDALAASLLALAPLLIPETGRRPLFGPPVTPAADASPGDRLIAFLGREPLPLRLASARRPRRMDTPVSPCLPSIGAGPWERTPRYLWRVRGFSTEFARGRQCRE